MCHFEKHENYNVNTGYKRALILVAERVGGGELRGQSSYKSSNEQFWRIYVVLNFQARWRLLLGSMPIIFWQQMLILVVEGCK